MTARYAIYFAPPHDSALWRFGSQVIGYDAETADNLPPPPGLPVPAEWPVLTEDPRRYGFHATLKAPFRLAEGRREEELLERAAAFAAGRAGFALPQMKVVLLGSFVAIVPAAPSGPLQALAADCVRAFDPLRAPMRPEDRQRRLASNLSDRQIAHLDAWGYPYVFEEFRFHLTLTGSLPPERREPVRDMLAAAYARLAPGIPVDGLAVDGLAGKGLAVDGIAIFRQDDPAGRFRILARMPFEASAGPGRVPRPEC